MENRAHALAAGLFTLLLGIGVLIAAQWFSRDNYEKVQYTLVSNHSVSGLNVQASVRLRGVEVGKVDVIEFDGDDPRNILIKINVKGVSFKVGVIRVSINQAPSNSWAEIDAVRLVGTP